MAVYVRTYILSIVHCDDNGTWLTWCRSGVRGKGGVQVVVASMIFERNRLHAGCDRASVCWNGTGSRTRGMHRAACLVHHQ